MNQESSDRRPLKTRGKAWVGHFTRLLLRTGITPNQISVLSVVFALLGFFCFYYGGESVTLLILAAVFIQLRLLANMMDGLVAVEGGRKTHNGELYNEVPDRLGDILFLVGAGYASGSAFGVTLAWVAIAGAIMAPYIRMQGAALLNGEHDFCGPFAKPHRMFALTVTALLAAFLPGLNLILIGLWIIAIGTWATVVRRTYRISCRLERERS